MEHLEAEVTGLLGLLEELASNLPPGPFSPEPDLLGGGEWLRGQRDTCWVCHLGPLAAPSHWWSQNSGHAMHPQGQNGYHIISLRVFWSVLLCLFSPWVLASY